MSLDQGPVTVFDVPKRARPSFLAWRVEASALVRLAAPLVASQLAQMGLLTTDVLFLGRFSAHALASAAIGNAVYYFAWLIGLGPASAVAPVVAHAIGRRANEKAGVRAAARMGLWAAMLSCVALIPLLLFTRPILIALGQDRDLAAGAGRFTAALCLGLPFSLGFQVLRNVSTALGRPGAPLLVTAVAVGWNALADYVLIFGHFGLRSLGLTGSGLATASSGVFAFAALYAVMQLTPALRAYRLQRRFHRPHWPRLWELVRLGGPIGATMVFEAMLFNGMTLFMGRFGPAALAGHQVALNAASLAFMTPLGIGMAAAVRVGRFAGADDLAGARRAGFTAMGVAGLFMLVSAGVLWLGGAGIVALYIPGNSRGEMAASALAVSFLKIAAAFQIFDGLQVAAGFALRGLKDARAPMLLAAASYWLVGAPMCVWLALGLGWRGLGVWTGLAIGLFTAAALLGARFHLLTRSRGPVRQAASDGGQYHSLERAG